MNSKEIANQRGFTEAPATIDMNIRQFVAGNPMGLTDEEWRVIDRLRSRWSGLRSLGGIRLSFIQGDGYCSWLYGSVLTICQRLVPMRRTVGGSVIEAVGLAVGDRQEWSRHA